MISLRGSPAPTPQVYGQSGTGKSRIFEGSSADPAAVGIVPRVLTEVLSIREQIGLHVTLAVFTVNNECVCDNCVSL